MAGCPGDRGPELPQNLLLVTVDTLRADHLGCYGYEQDTSPQIDSLARRGVRFTSVTTSVPITAPSHASMFTGMYPPTHGVRTNGHYRLRADALTLAEQLKEQGFQTAAFVAAIPLDHRFGLHQGFDEYDDDLTSSTMEKGRAENWYGLAVVHGERRAQDVVDRALAWHRERPPGRYFLWVHVFDPHSPYDPPAPFDAVPWRPPAEVPLARIKGRGIPWHRWLEPYRDTSEVLALYDGEIRYTDHHIGRLLDAVAGPNTLVSLSADHGESLTEHGAFFFHGDDVFAPSLDVPWIIAHPGSVAPGRRVEGRAQLVDLMPTLLELLGLEVPTGLDGRSHAAVARAGGRVPDRPSYHEALLRNRSGRGFRALQRGSWKLIQGPRGGVRLFNLARDPGEMRDLSAQRPGKLAALRSELSRWVKRLGNESSATAILDPSELKALQSLGYVE